MKFLINTSTLRVLCRTESVNDAQLIADKLCRGDSYIGDSTSPLAAFTLPQINTLLASMLKHPKEQVSRSFAVKTFYEATLSVDVKTPADYGIRSGTQPSSPETGENDMATAKKKPAAKKAAAKKAPAKKVAAVKTEGWTRPTRGKTLALWELFDKRVTMKTATRKGMLDRAVEQGFNVATATTQYGRWLTVHVANGGTAPDRSVRAKKAA